MYHTREASDHKVTHTSLNGGGLYRPVHVETLRSQKLRMLQKGQIREGSQSARASLRNRHHGLSIMGFEDEVEIGNNYAGRSS